MSTKPGIKRMIHLAACDIRDEVELRTYRSYARSGICESLRSYIQDRWWSGEYKAWIQKTLPDPEKGQEGKLCTPSHAIGHHTEELFRSWHSYSGVTYYPVPHPDYMHGEYEVKRDWAERAFNATDELGMWDVETEYGALRMSLLDHIIEQTKDAT